MLQQVMLVGWTFLYTDANTCINEANGSPRLQLTNFINIIRPCYSLTHSHLVICTDKAHTA